MRDPNEPQHHKMTLHEDTGPYHGIEGKFDGISFSNDPILDTNVDLNIPTFAITWKDKESLMKELAEVIRKYAI